MDENAKIFLRLGISIIILFILFINFYQYLFVFEVDYSAKKELFKNCKTNIDVSEYPKTATQWRKLSDKQEIVLQKMYNMKDYLIEPNYVSDLLKSRYDVDKKIIELAISLGDDVNKKKSFIGGLYVVNNYVIGYYNHQGNLLFVEKRINTLKG